MEERRDLLLVEIPVAQPAARRLDQRVGVGARFRGGHLAERGAQADGEQQLLLRGHHHRAVEVEQRLAAPHRAEAYDASRYIIEATKRRVPLWKKEHLASGARWVGGEPMHA